MGWGRRFVQDLKLFALILSLVATLLLVLAYGPLRDLELLRIVAASLGSTCFSLLAVRVFYEWFAASRIYDSFRILTASQAHGLVDVLTADELPYEDMIRQAKEIVFEGSALRVLGRKTVEEALLQRARSGARITVVLSDPRATATQARYEDEPPFEPEIALEGLVSRVEKLWEMRSTAEVDPEAFRIFLNTRYPTLAVFRFDDDYFVYFYGYWSRGIWSPVLHFRDRRKPGTRFFDSHVDDLVERGAAVPVTKDVLHSLRHWAANQHD